MVKTKRNSLSPLFQITWETKTRNICGLYCLLRVARSSAQQTTAETSDTYVTVQQLPTDLASENKGSTRATRGGKQVTRTALCSMHCKLLAFAFLAELRATCWVVWKGFLSHVLAPWSANANKKQLESLCEAGIQRSPQRVLKANHEAKRWKGTANQKGKNPATSRLCQCSCGRFTSAKLAFS